MATLSDSDDETWESVDPNEAQAHIAIMPSGELQLMAAPAPSPVLTPPDVFDEQYDAVSFPASPLTTGSNMSSDDLHLVLPETDALPPPSQPQPEFQPQAEPQPQPQPQAEPQAEPELAHSEETTVEAQTAAQLHWSKLQCAADGVMGDIVLQLGCFVHGKAAMVVANKVVWFALRVIAVEAEHSTAISCTKIAEALSLEEVQHTAELFVDSHCDPGGGTMQGWERVLDLSHHIVDPLLLQPGDHVYVYRNGVLFAHHGIYEGDGQIIHFYDPTAVSFGNGGSALPYTNAAIQRTTLQLFTRGNQLRRVQYDAPWLETKLKRAGSCHVQSSDPSATVLQRAVSKLGQGQYDVVSNNCEQFCIWCKIGKVPSSWAATDQVSTTSRSVGSMLMLLATPKPVPPQVALPMMLLGGLCLGGKFVYDKIREGGAEIREQPRAIQERGHVEDVD